MKRWAETTMIAVTCVLVVLAIIVAWLLVDILFQPNTSSGFLE